MIKFLAAVFVTVLSDSVQTLQVKFAKFNRVFMAFKLSRVILYFLVQVFFVLVVELNKVRLMSPHKENHYLVQKSVFRELLIQVEDSFQEN